MKPEQKMFEYQMLRGKTEYLNSVAFPEDRIARYDNLDEIMPLLERLAKRNKRFAYVISSLYLDGKTYTELRKELGISDASVRHLEKRALRHLSYFAEMRERMRKI
jgi:DNA-directed RNA polymerase sigma subunit (sigma70/sigma32)